MTMHNPPHPGLALKKFCGIGPGFELSVTEAAEMLGIARTNLSRILNGHAGITASMALRIASKFGGSGRPLKYWNACLDHLGWPVGEATGIQ